MRLRWLIAIAVALIAAGPLFALSGIYDVAATTEHSLPVYWLLHRTTIQSVRLHSRAIEAPPLGDPARIERGLVLYRDHCAQCHGAPGTPPHPFALGLNPAALNLAEVARSWTAPEIYWTVRHGVLLTGMPAWEARMSDNDLWSIVAFIEQLPAMSPADYRARAERAGPVKTSDADLR